MFKDALFASSSRTRPRSPRPSMSRRSATLSSTRYLHVSASSGALLRRWTSSTRPTSIAGETSHSAARSAPRGTARPDTMRQPGQLEIIYRGQVIRPLHRSAKSKQPYSRCSRSAGLQSAKLPRVARHTSEARIRRQKDTQAPLEHRRPQGWRTRHNHGRGGRSSRANRTARKAARSGASVWARAASQPEAKAAEQPGFNGVTFKSGGATGGHYSRWRQASRHERWRAWPGATSTFDVDTCGGNLCAQTTTHQGIMTSGDACGSAHPRFEHTDIGGTVGEGKEARTAGIIETDNPDTRGEADVESGVVVTEPCVTYGKVEKNGDCCLGEADTGTKTCEGAACTAWPTSIPAQSSTSAPQSTEELNKERPEHFRRRLICQLHILAIACIHLITGMVMGRIDEHWATSQGPTERHLSKEAAPFDICAVCDRGPYDKASAPSATWTPIHTSSAQSGWPEDGCFSVGQPLIQDACTCAGLGAHACSHVGSHDNGFAAEQHLVSGVCSNGKFCAHTHS